MIPTRVYVSVPMTNNLSLQDQQMKAEFLELLKRSDMDPQEFPASGLPVQMAWNFESVTEVLARCQGAVILGLPRGQINTPPDVYNAPTSYNHYEGALALAYHLPTLIIADPGIEPRGIFAQQGGNFIVYTQPNAGASWLTSNEFQVAFKNWRKKVQSRFHVFFGYCGKASLIAKGIIKKQLVPLHVKTMAWQKHFRSGHTILEEIERASRSCIGGIFLFTKDDHLKSGTTRLAAPRDNVIFETGYFLEMKGKDRVLIIREKGAKMPADLGGHIYVELEDRHKLSAIEPLIQDFISRL